MNQPLRQWLTGEKRREDKNTQIWISWGRTIDQLALHISITCNILEHIIHRIIISDLDQQRILTAVQHGFCKSQSCETQLSKTVNNLTKSLKEGQQVDSILLGFSKVFDVVSHQKLLLHTATHQGIFFVIVIVFLIALLLFNGHKVQQ